MMEEILKEHVPVWLGIILTLVGMFIFNVAMIFPKAKTFAEISVSIWWKETQIRFSISTIIIAVVFYMSWYYDTLTAEHCLELGLIGNLIIDRIIKATNGQAVSNKSKGN